MNERVSFEIKRKSPPAPPFSSLHQSQLYPLSPLLSFIITARDFIPALEAAGPTRSAREKEETRGTGCFPSEMESTIDFWHRDYCKTLRRGWQEYLDERKKNFRTLRVPIFRRGNESEFAISRETEERRCKIKIPSSGEPAQLQFARFRTNRCSFRNPATRFNVALTRDDARATRCVEAASGELALH